MDDVFGKPSSISRTQVLMHLSVMSLCNTGILCCDYRLSKYKLGTGELQELCLENKFSF